jgi:hypothetical protein
VTRATWHSGTALLLLSINRTPPASGDNFDTFSLGRFKY